MKKKKLTKSSAIKIKEPKLLSKKEMKSNWKQKKKWNEKLTSGKNELKVKQASKAKASKQTKFQRTNHSNRFEIFATIFHIFPTISFSLLYFSFTFRMILGVSMSSTSVNDLQTKIFFNNES